VEERVQSYTDTVREVEAAVAELQEEVWTEVTDSLVAFVRAATEVGGSTIPTAVLLTGANMPDHSRLFALLASKLEAVTPHTSLLGPGLGLKAMVAQVVAELTSDEEETMVRRADASITALAAWYQARYPGTHRPPLVIVLQQFEGSGGAALQDLVHLVSRAALLPVVLVLGLATGLPTLHRALSQATTARLTLHTFGSPPAVLCLDRLVERVVVATIVPFKLHYRVFQFLVENFLYHDFAVSHFMEGWKVVLGEHYHRHPSSLLCCPPATRAARLQAMGDSQLDCLRRLPSMREYIEGEALGQQAAILTCPATCRQVVAHLLDNLHHQGEVFTCLARALHQVARDLPRRPLGRTLRVTYELCLAGQVTAGHQFKEAWRYLQLSSRTDLQKKVGLVLEELATLTSLTSLPSSPLTALTSLLTAAHGKLVALGEEVEEAEEREVGEGSVPPSPAVTALHSKLHSLPPSGISSLVNTPSLTPSLTPCTSTTNSPAPSLPHKLDRFSLKQQLQGLKDKERRGGVGRPYDTIRTEVVSALLAAFTEHLIPPSSLPLHEVTTFTSLAAVKRHLVGAPRAALHTALTQPGEYLRVPELAISDPGEIPATFPDLAIGYKLHLECPRLINVFDWLTCWNSIVTGEEDDHAEIPARQQARFARVVAELQMLGFIKSSNKKTDHVARLTFGGS